MSGSAAKANIDWWENIIREHQARAEKGDLLSVRTVCAFNLLVQGWQPGDPLPDVSDHKIVKN